MDIASPFNVTIHPRTDGTSELHVQGPGVARHGRVMAVATDSAEYQAGALGRFLSDAFDAGRRAKAAEIREVIGARGNDL